MFDLYQRQFQKVESIPNGVSRARALTLEFLSRCRSAKVSFVTVKNPGIFLGLRGSNLRALQERTCTTILNRGPRTGKQFMVFYNTETDGHTGSEKLNKKTHTNVSAKGHKFPSSSLYLF
jgi:hypothetical protein